MPVAGDSGREFGCVLTFQGTEQIQAREGKLRKQIHSDSFTARYHFSTYFTGTSYMGQSRESDEYVEI